MRTVAALLIAAMSVAPMAAAEDGVRLDLTLQELQAVDYAVRTSDLAARIAVPLLVKIEAQAKGQGKPAPESLP